MLDKSIVCLLIIAMFLQQKSTCGLPAALRDAFARNPSALRLANARQQQMYSFGKLSINNTRAVVVNMVEELNKTSTELPKRAGFIYLRNEIYIAVQIFDQDYQFFRSGICTTFVFQRPRS